MNWTDTLKAIAPTIATLMGGPLAGAGVRALSEALLGKPDGAIEEIKNLIVGGLSPEQIAAVQRGDQEFAVKMRELDVRLEDIEAGDRKDARAREIAMGIWGAVGIHVLAAVILAGFFGTVYWVFTGELPKDPNKLLLIGTVIGYVSAKADQVVGYFFGSSAGSKQKTDAMAHAIGQMRRP